MNNNMFCPFCEELKHMVLPYHDKKYANLVKNGKTILMETKFFVIFPDYGAVRIGHALIVPKRHIISFSYLNHEEINELDNLLSMDYIFMRIIKFV